MRTKVTEETIKLIKENLKNINYKVEKDIHKYNNGDNWELHFSNFKIIIYHTGSTNFQRIGKNGYEDKEKDFLLELVKRIIETGEEVYSDENKKYIDILNEFLSDTAEKSYFDFKRNYSEPKKIVKELMSLLNNTDDKEAYLIFGISDDKEIDGLSNEDKINEDNFNDTISKLNFGAGHLKEAIMFKDVQYKDKKLQLIVCKRYDFVPIYLTQSSPDSYKKYVGQIYTRVGGTNQPATYDDMKKLWKIHFERIK